MHSLCVLRETSDTRHPIMVLPRSPIGFRDDGLQRGHRPTPTRAIVPLPSQVGAAAAGAPAATSSDKSTNSQYKFSPPAENPQSEKQNGTPPQQQQKTRLEEEVVDWNSGSQDRTSASSSAGVLENRKEPDVILAASAPRVTSVSEDTRFSDIYVSKPDTGELKRDVSFLSLYEISEIKP